MSEEKIKDLITLLSKHLFKECDELYSINIAQIFSITNFLIKSNIPFVLTFSEGTRGTAKSISLAITLSPTCVITKVYQLEEGFIPIP